MHADALVRLPHDDERTNGHPAGAPGWPFVQAGQLVTIGGGLRSQDRPFRHVGIGDGDIAGCRVLQAASEEGMPSSRARGGTATCAASGFESDKDGGHADDDQLA